MQKKGEGGSKVRRKGARAAALRYRSHGSAAKHTRVRVLGPQALVVFAALTDRMEVWVPPAVPQRLEQGLHAPHSPTLQLAAVAVAASHTAPVEQARACTRVTLPLAHTGCVVAKDMGMVNRTRVEVPSPHLASHGDHSDHCDTGHSRDVIAAAQDLSSLQLLLENT